MRRLRSHCSTWLAIVAAGLVAAGQIAVGQAPPGQPWVRHVIDNASRGADGVRLADVNGDGLLDIATGWEQGGAVRLCLNPGSERAREMWPAVTVGNVPGVEDAVAVDLDGDGAMDVVSCAEGKSRVISIHWAPSVRERLLEASAWRTELLPAADGAMAWMFALPLQVDQQHGLDLVAGGKSRDAAIGWFAAAKEARRLAAWKWHPLREVGWLMSLVAEDMDGDGDPDIVFSDRKGKRAGAYWLENPGRDWHLPERWSEHLIGGEGSEAMFLEIADLDGDGRKDVLLATQPREVLWFGRRDEGGLSWEKHRIPVPETAGITKAVRVADLDRDGRVDLVFSCEQAKPPKQGLMWLSSVGALADGTWQAHVLSGVDGVKHDLIGLVDLDGDGDPDVVTTEEVSNLGVIWYENPSTPR